MSNEHVLNNESEMLASAEAAPAEVEMTEENAQEPAKVSAADLQALKQTLSQRPKLLIAGGAALAAVVLLAVALSFALAGNPAAILVNGQQVAAMKNEEQANAAVAAYLAAQTKEIGNEVFFAEQVTVVPEAREGSEVLNRSKALNALALTTTLKTNGAAILVDGQPLVFTADEQTAKEALENLKLTYLPEDDTMQVLDVKFKQEIKVQPQEVLVAELSNLDEAKLAMKDTSLTGEAPVTVLVVLEKTKVEEVPFDTSYEVDGTLRYGQTKVKQAGVNGSREVTIQLAQANGEEIARQEISSNTLVKPVEEIVLEGAVVQTASRSLTQATEAGMIWPTTATRISSYYGPRSRDNHSGLDIDGDSGDPVWAAKAGTVVSAGYHGTYGNEVVISHGDGLQTRYARMQSILVSEGDEVEIGQQIGLEGSTGKSTGSHLHFEVIVNGSTTDPLLYIK